MVDDRARLNRLSRSGKDWYRLRYQTIERKLFADTEALMTANAQNIKRIALYLANKAK